MRPANVPLCLIPGTTHRSTLRIMQPTWIYKPVTGIEASAPVRLHVPDHGIETDSWPCWLAGVQHMPELNRDPPRERPHRMRTRWRSTASALPAASRGVVSCASWGRTQRADGRRLIRRLHAF